MSNKIQAGQFKAGEPIAADGNLVDLLDFGSVAAGVKVGDVLRERLAATDSAIVKHAATADDAALAGDDAERAHAAEAARLDREANRLRLAIDRADSRLAEVADAERKADARAKIPAAAKDAARAELIAAADYPAAAAAVAALLVELGELQARIRAARAGAAEAGIADEAAGLVLPHEKRSCREVAEDVEVVTRTPAPGVYTRGGHRLDGQPPEVIESRTTERRIVQARFTAPDLTAARAVLPDPDGGRLLDRGED